MINYYGLNFLNSIIFLNLYDLCPLSSDPSICALTQLHCIGILECIKIMVENGALLVCIRMALVADIEKVPLLHAQGYAQMVSVVCIKI